jgi:hypothetical protein
LLLAGEMGTQKPSSALERTVMVLYTCA